MNSKVSLVHGDLTIMGATHRLIGILDTYAVASARDPQKRGILLSENCGDVTVSLSPDVEQNGLGVIDKKTGRNSSWLVEFLLKMME